MPSRRSNVGSTTATRSPRTAGQRAELGADDILLCALTIAQAEGVEAISMRRLASALDVAPNALYTYYDSKTAILDAVLDSVLATIAVDPAPAADWREGLSDILRASRQLLLQHPALVPLFVARPGGTHALRLGERMLQHLADGGITGSDAVVAMRTLLTFMLGSVAMQVPRDAAPDREERLAAVRNRIAADGAHLPTISARTDDIATHPGTSDFETGLRWLLNGIDDGRTAP